MDVITNRITIQIGASSDDARRKINQVSSSLSKLRSTNTKIRVESKDVDKAKKKVSALSNILNSLKRIVFYRMVRSAIKAVSEAFSEGAENAYWYSKTVGDSTKYISQSYDSLSSGSFKMQNQLGAAWATLKSTITPILLEIIEIVTSAANTITQFFSVLGGNGTYLKAIDYSKKWADTTSSGASSAKEWKNQLMGFDEINRLEKSSSSSGGSGSNQSDYKNMFEESNVDSWLQNIKDKLTNLRESLDFEPLRESWDKLSESVKQLGNNIINSLGWAFDNILAPLAEWTIESALPAGIELLANALDLLINVGEKLAPVFDDLWQNVLKPIAEFIGDEFVASIKWISDTIADLSQKVKNASSLGEFIQSLDGKETIIFAIAGAFATLNVVATIFGTVSKLVSTSISLVTAEISAITSPAGLAIIAFTTLILLGIHLYQKFDSVREAFDKVGEKFGEFSKRVGEPKYWGELASSIVTAISTAIGALLGEAWKAITNLFKKPDGDTTVETFGEGAVTDFLDGILNACKNIGSWIDENVITPFLKGWRDALGIASPSTVMEEIGGYVIAGLELGISNMMSGFGAWFTETVWAPISSAIQSVEQSIMDWWSGVKSFFGGGSGKVTVRAGGTSINKAGYSHYSGSFASGGFPEDGLFFANHRELVGKFSNGRTAVANNEEITEGISRAVYEAFVDAFTQTSGGRGDDQPINVYLDGKVIARSTTRYQNQFARAYG